MHVDDFLSVGTNDFEMLVLKKLGSNFLIGSTETGIFKYLGHRIQEWKNGITLDQVHYAALLKPIDISKQRSTNKSSELSDKEKKEYRTAVGQLGWIAKSTRPDIAFDVCELSVAFTRATVNDLLKLNKVIFKVSSDHLQLFFPKVFPLENCYLECFSDASFANLSDNGSQGGFIVFLKNENGLRCPLLWQTRKIRRVVKSTLAAETLALLECAETAVYLKAESSHK